MFVFFTFWFWFCNKSTAFTLARKVTENTQAQTTPKQTFAEDNVQSAKRPTIHDLQNENQLGNTPTNWPHSQLQFRVRVPTIWCAESKNSRLKMCCYFSLCASTIIQLALEPAILIAQNSIEPSQNRKKTWYRRPWIDRIRQLLLFSWRWSRQGTSSMRCSLCRRKRQSRRLPLLFRTEIRNQICHI